MKVIGISGSPRKDGNTEGLVGVCLNEFKTKCWETTAFYLSERLVKPCIGCETCVETGNCVIDDDDAAALFNELACCDAVIIGSPVYWRNITAQLKAVFDRTFSRGHNLFGGKPCGAIAVGRGEGAGQTLTHAAIHNYILSCGGLVVPGDLNSLSARADKPRDILLQERRLAQARLLAQNVIKYAEKLKE